ncbi:hypothetical protein [Pseudomonas sp.]|uniref:hypothetical protein n=1 Tax=Pseudomonas sp. TaxID=306 RepID=UPI0028B02F68|nr:hypothetical protein [Pseudomonas sp.]
MRLMICIALAVTVAEPLVAATADPPFECPPPASITQAQGAETRMGKCSEGGPTVMGYHYSAWSRSGEWAGFVESANEANLQTLTLINAVLHLYPPLCRYRNDDEVEITLTLRP